MQRHNRNKSTKRSLAYGGMITLTFAFGAAPGLLALSVDPYEVFRTTDRPTAITDLAEKAHYPLWKLAKYRPGEADTIILGDSRARALRDKYWHELGLTGALNLAYGGGTIPEIYETFKIIRSDENVKNLVIGIQLRSFDEDHKDGMNRVPEAERILENKLEYVKNWSVIKSAWKIFASENEETIAKVQQAMPKLVGNAKAGSLTTAAPTRLDALLDPEICFSCSLPQDVDAVPFPRRVGYGRGYFGQGYFDGFGYLGRREWTQAASLYFSDEALDELPRKFEKQIRGSGKADWADFEFSQTYWDHLVEISRWAKQNDKNLVFVIPPTVVKLQATIKAGGLEQLNHQLRVELSKLGTVFDFDFPNAMTRQTANFSDAYHFNSKIARQLTGEMAVHLVPSVASHKRYRQHQAEFGCRNGANRVHASAASETTINMTAGKNCRVWSEAL